MSDQAKPEPTDAERIAALEKMVSGLTAHIAQLNAQCQALANQRNKFANEAATFHAQLSVAQSR